MSANDHTTEYNHDYRASSSRAVKLINAYGINKAKQQRQPHNSNMLSLPPKKTITATTRPRDIPEPKSHAQAKISPYRDYFRAAEERETESLIAKTTWTIERPTHTVTVIKGAFVYKVKELENGFVEKIKARYVAKGYSQIPGLHYRDSFAPVASATAIRAILLTALEHNWPVHHVDISTAFLNAEIEEGVEI